MINQLIIIVVNTYTVYQSSSSWSWSSSSSMHNFTSYQQMTWHAHAHTHTTHDPLLQYESSDVQIYLHADLGMAIYGLHGPKSSNPKKGCLEYLSTWSPIHPWIWSIWHLILPTHSMICIYKTWYRKSGWNLTNPSESTFQKKYFWDIVEFLPFWVGEHQDNLQPQARPGSSTSRAPKRPRPSVLSRLSRASMAPPRSEGEQLSR